MSELSLFTMPQTGLSTNDHYTSKWIFDLLDVEFDIDVAAPPGGVAWIPAKRSFSQAEDGLGQPWSGLVWCNPPFSNIEPWIDRLIKHGNGIALLPHTKGSWRRKVWREADAIAEWDSITEVRFMHAGKEKTIFPTTFLAAWGELGTKALANVGRVRR